MAFERNENFLVFAGKIFLCQLGSRWLVEEEDEDEEEAEEGEDEEG